METKKNFSPGMSVGSSSILVTFVLLCLVTFAALSFVSARADHKLSVQTAARISKYYEADSTAEIQLANISSLLSKYALDKSESEYFAGLENLFSDNELYTIFSDDTDSFIHYQVESTDSQAINVTIKVLYPDNNNGNTFEIIEWENVSTFTPSDSSLEEEKGGLLF